MKKTLMSLAAVALLMPAVAMAERTGEEVYSSKCIACHMSGAAGAPKLGDAPAWALRAEKGMDVLLGSVKNGLNGMPPMGICMDCSDGELTASIQYILDNSK